MSLRAPEEPSRQWPKWFLFPGYLVPVVRACSMEYLVASRAPGETRSGIILSPRAGSHTP